MSVRKQVLEVPTRTRLKQIGGSLGRDYPASMKKGEVVNRLNRTRSISLVDILGEMLQSELKLACIALKVDSSGREKKALIHRLLAVERVASRPRSSESRAVRSKSLMVAHRSQPIGRNAHEICKSSERSNILNGVDHMDDPKEIDNESGVGSGEREDVQRLELVWPRKKRTTDRVVLPFQCIETVNESRATREAQKGTMFHGQARQEADEAADEWRNKLVWGDNKYVLSSLLDNYAGKVDVIYTDPPFGTGQDFTVKVEIGGKELEKDPSLIEEKAYRDTWGNGIESYLSMLYDRLRIMRELLSEGGAIFVHLDVHMGPYVKVLLDEVFGRDNFQNEIAWYYYNKMHDSRKRLLPKAFDQILYYVKSKSSQQYTYNSLTEKRDEPVKQLKRVKVNGKMVNARDENGKVIYQVKDTRYVDTVWRIRCLQPANKKEWVNYATQKPVDLVERVLSIASSPGDLVLDPFVGSGTTAVAAERLGRRWIAADLSRYSIHVTRKRLLEEDGCRPFEVLNLGKYERQYWQGVTFGDGNQKALHDYIKFILDIYKAEPASGLVHLHGQSAGYMVHIGAADAPITLAEIRDAVDECRKIGQKKLDILGWEWEMGLHDVVEAESQCSGVKLRLLQIPRECMDKRAAEAGDVHFYELAYLEVQPEAKGKSLCLKLKNFVIPNPELIPDDIRKKVKKWSDFIDYWAVDFDFKDDTFHNQWQDYRTRAKRDLELTTDWHDYEMRGQYKVLVKVFDIFGNDTTHLLEVHI